MGYINLAEKTINAKLVYYGTGLGGKTTSLQAIHGILCPSNEVKLVSINTDQDATLLFDFLPINLGLVEGFKIRIQGYTVPGQPKYRVMRKYVLSGADAVVLVVDSQASRLEENRQALADLKANLRANGLDPEKIPMAVQYNKQDLPDLTPTRELDRIFRFREMPAHETVATEGKGVFETFVEATRSLVAEKIRHYGLGQGGVDPKEIAEGAVERLHSIRASHQRNAEEDAHTFDVVTLTVSEKVAKEGLCTGQPEREAGFAGLAPESAPIAATSGPTGAEADAAFTLPPEWEVVEGEEGPADPAPLADAGDDGEASSEQLLGKVVQSNVELANLYAELDEYKNLLLRKNEEMVEISQIISHDLKKPLTALKTVISLLRQGYLGELTEPQADAIQNAFEASAYMEELIGDILDSTRLDHDGMELEFEEVDMTLLVGEILRRLKYHLSESNVAVRVEPLPTIRCDVSAVTKIFTNLVGNGINYRDPTRGPYLHIAAEAEGDHHLFRVEDNGIGIPTTDQETVFQKFKRGSNTGGINGSGLGLYIVRALARKHGGDVTFTSTRGEGTTFTVRLPKEPVAPAEES